MSEETTAVALRPAMSVGQAMGVQEILAQVSLIQEVMGKVMKEGEHYGTIPGCGDKKTLLQPGAQKLTMTFRLCPEYDIQEVNLDRSHKEYRITCTLKTMGSGGFVAQGVGCCSTMESKYRFRGGARRCPECGKETIIKGKAEFGGGWLCWQKKGGCGTKWPDGAAEIESQSIDKVENDNPADCYNTVLKMAKKRAFVDATITATAASDIFTQDVGDEEAETTEPENKAPAEKPKATSTAKAAKVAKPEPSEQDRLDHEMFVQQLRKLCGKMEPEVLRWLRDCPAKSGKFLLMPNEGFEDLALADLKAMVNRWDTGYPKIEEWLRENPAKPAQAPATASTDPNSPDAAWRSFPMPFGKNAGKALADLDKKYLYGLWANFVVETMFKGNPKKTETVMRDKEFRAHLDQAGIHYGFTKPEDQRAPGEGAELEHPDETNPDPPYDSDHDSDQDVPF